MAQLKDKMKTSSEETRCLKVVLRMKILSFQMNGQILPSRTPGLYAAAINRRIERVGTTSALRSLPAIASSRSAGDAG